MRGDRNTKVKMDASGEHSIDVDSLEIGSSEKNIGFKVRHLRNERRKDIYHYVVHGIACFILVSYILFIVFNYELPAEFSTIVSVVIGFYFARSLFQNS